MIQYIPKAVVMVEIEKLYNGEIDTYTRNILYRLKSNIDSIEVKKVDLEKEMDKEWNKCEPIDEGMGLEIASIEHEQFDNIVKHFFELGLKEQKENKL